MIKPYSDTARIVIMFRIVKTYKIGVVHCCSCPSPFSWGLSEQAVLVRPRNA